MEMNVIIWLTIGALVGWATSKLTGSPEGILMDITAGVGGAFVGGLLLGPLVGAGPVNSADFSTAGLAMSLLGAVVLLAVLNLVRRASAR
jgi:uncharacterized membrane protein YeaQ/YmgE (transglycosylase-associated protein family)